MLLGVSGLMHVPIYIYCVYGKMSAFLTFLIAKNCSETITDALTNLLLFCVCACSLV